MVGKSGTKTAAKTIDELPAKPTTQAEYNAFFSTSGNKRMVDHQVSHCFRITSDTIAQAVADISSLITAVPGLEALLCDSKTSKTNPALEGKKKIRAAFQADPKYAPIFGDAQPEALITERHKTEAFNRLIWLAIQKLRRSNDSTDARLKQEEATSRLDSNTAWRAISSSPFVQQLDRTASPAHTRSVGLSAPPIIQDPTAPPTPSRPSKYYAPGRHLSWFNPNPTDALQDLTDVCVRFVDAETGRTITKVTIDLFCGDSEDTNTATHSGLEVYPDLVRIDRVKNYITPFMAYGDGDATADRNIPPNVEIFYGQTIVKDDDELQSELLQFKRGPRESCEVTLHVRRREQVPQAQDVDMIEPPLLEPQTPGTKRKVGFSTPTEISTGSPCKKTRHRAALTPQGKKASKRRSDTGKGAGDKTDGARTQPVRRTTRLSRKVAHDGMVDSGAMGDEETGPVALSDGSSDEYHQSNEPVDDDDDVVMGEM